MVVLQCCWLTHSCLCDVYLYYDQYLKDFCLLRFSRYIELCADIVWYYEAEGRRVGRWIVGDPGAISHYLLHPKDSIQEMRKLKVNLYTQSSLLAQLHLLPYTYIYITASDVGHGWHHIWSINRRSASKWLYLSLYWEGFCPKCTVPVIWHTVQNTCQHCCEVSLTIKLIFILKFFLEFWPLQLYVWACCLP